MREKVMALCLIFSRAAYKFILLIIAASEICNEIYAHSWMLRICCLVSFVLLMVAMIRERKYPFPSADEEWYGYLKRLSWPWLVVVLIIYVANMRNSKESSWFYYFGFICTQSVIALFLLRYWFMSVILNERLKNEKESETK